MKILENTENLDLESASQMLRLRQGKITYYGATTLKTSQTSLLDIAFDGGLNAADSQRWLGTRPDPGRLTKGQRLKMITDGLIMQNPPRSIRPWAKLPKEL